ARLSNGWTISTRRVSGEPRIEISGQDVARFREELKRNGVIEERIQYKLRYFIPTGDRAEEVFESVTKNRPIVDMIPSTRGSGMGTGTGGPGVREMGERFGNAVKSELDKLDGGVGIVPRVFRGRRIPPAA